MEGLIREAFLHVEVIGPLVLEGHYDLVGPSGRVLPDAWDTVVEPGWVISMSMWPMPGPPLIVEDPEDKAIKADSTPITGTDHKNASTLERRPRRKSSALGDWMSKGKTKPRRTGTRGLLTV